MSRKPAGKPASRMAGGQPSGKNGKPASRMARDVKEARGQASEQNDQGPTDEAACPNFGGWIHQRVPHVLGALAQHVTLVDAQAIQVQA